ncbi:MAG: peptidoglycan glycosyltransferase, partial [Eubacterium sp.]|nr:peptidoglycan glycosyltransferase [Eubacterium sp.]
MYEYDSIKDFLKSFFKSRLLVLSLVILLMGGVLLHRLFTLQIVNGQSYQDNYTLRICKERVLNGTRGNILDCNGKTLAYNELTYKVTLEDNGTYSGTDERNEALNTIIAKVLTVLEENGDDFVNDFNIRIKKNGTYAFTVEDTQLMRFRADIYGKKKIEDLGFDDKLGYNTAEATEDQIIEYLCSEKRYGLADTDYSPEMKYKIMVIRYALAQNGYQKYISTTIAADISDKTMAYIRENKADLQGVDIEEDYIRKYDDSIYFASIIGYTGKISTEEYEELSKVNDSYELTDVIGKSGIEQIMDEKLQGAKGSETVFVDVMGKELEVTDHKEPSAGNN